MLALSIDGLCKQLITFAIKFINEYRIMNYFQFHPINTSWRGHRPTNANVQRNCLGHKREELKLNSWSNPYWFLIKVKKCLVVFINFCNFVAFFDMSHVIYQFMVLKHVCHRKYALRNMQYRNLSVKQFYHWNDLFSNQIGNIQSVIYDYLFV